MEVRCGSWADMGTYVMDLSGHIGEELYIELCDEGGGAWAHAFFDEGVTYYENKPDWKNTEDTVANSVDQTPASVNISWRLASNLVGATSEPMPEEAQVTNGGFELGNLEGWTPLTDGFNKDTAVISAQTYWGEALPYNQAGNYHLDGWNTGIAEPDPWSVKSSTFELAGSGYISVRMGGNAAAVKVYEADGTLVGYYRQNRWSDTGYPNVVLYCL